MINIARAKPAYFGNGMRGTALQSSSVVPGIDDGARIGRLFIISLNNQVHTTIGCGEQGFPSAQPYLSHTPAG